jgi:hypothetical protein
MTPISSKLRAAILVVAAAASVSGCATGRCGWRDGGRDGGYGHHHRGDHCRADRDGGRHW